MLLSSTSSSQILTHNMILGADSDVLEKFTHRSKITKTRRKIQDTSKSASLVEQLGTGTVTLKWHPEKSSVLR